MQNPPTKRKRQDAQSNNTQEVWSNEGFMKFLLHPESTKSKNYIIYDIASLVEIDREDDWGFDQDKLDMILGYLFLRQTFIDSVLFPHRIIRGLSTMPRICRIRIVPRWPL